MTESQPLSGDEQEDFDAICRTIIENEASHAVMKHLYSFREALQAATLANQIRAKDNSTFKTQRIARICSYIQRINGLDEVSMAKESDIAKGKKTAKPAYKISELGILAYESVKRTADEE